MKNAGRYFFGFGCLSSKLLEMRTRTAIALAAAFTILQIGTLLALAPGSSVSERWLKFAQWDSAWFLSIAERGYVSDDPISYQDLTKANVAFFPSLPFLARGFSALSGMPLKPSLILVSHFACFLFWFYFFELCALLNVSKEATLAGALLLLAYFGSYFLALPYSEGFFLAGMLGMLRFTLRLSDRPRLFFLLAAFHGFLMAGSRLVGLLVCLYPLFHGVLYLWRVRGITVRGLLPYAGISAISALAPILFFAYCQARFGYWDLYFITQKFGWGAQFDFFLPYFPGEYFREIPDWFSNHGHLRGATLSRLVCVCFAGLVWLCIFFEFRWARGARDWRTLGWEFRLPLYACAWMIFSISLARAGAGAYYSGMYRYTLTTLVPVLLALLELGNRSNFGAYIKKYKYLFYSSSLVCAFGSVTLQLRLAWQFLNGVWME